MPNDETNSLDPGELAVLRRARADAAKFASDLHSSGALDGLAAAASVLESAGGLTQLASAAAALESSGRTIAQYQDTLSRISAQAFKLDQIAAHKPIEMPAIPYVRPIQHYILEATRETSDRLDDVVEVLRETVAIQKTEVESLADLYASMEETTRLTRALLRWAPGGVAVGFGAMFAAIAAVVVPLFT